MPIFTDSFWSIADNDLCNYFSVSPPVVKLSYYHAFSYVDGPLADADIRPFSPQTSLCCDFESRVCAGGHRERCFQKVFLC